MKYRFTDSDISMLRQMAARERRNTNRVPGRGVVIPRTAGGVGGVARVFLAVMDEDIQPGETKTASIWDRSVTPPVDTGDNVEVTLDWMTGGEPITTGKQIGYIVFGSINRVMWAECPDPIPAQQGDIDTESALPSAVADFNGTGYVEIGNVYDFNGTEAFSIETIVKTTQTSFGMMVGKMLNANTFRGYGLAVQANGSASCWVRSTTTDRLQVESVPTINDGAWHKVKMVYDGSSSAAGITCFIDDIQVSTNSLGDELLVGSTSSAATLRFGRRDGTGSPFTGQQYSIKIDNGNNGWDSIWELESDYLDSVGSFDGTNFGTTFIPYV